MCRLHIDLITFRTQISFTSKLFDIGAHSVKLRFNRWRMYRGLQPAGPAEGGATLVVLARCSMSCNSRRDQSSLLFFHKIHCGTMSINKDKYLTPSQSTRSTRSSHNSQYCRLPFSQGLFHIGIVWLHLWSQQRPQRSLGHSFK